MHFIFSHCGLGSPLGVRGKVRKKRKNEMPPIKYNNSIMIKKVLFFFLCFSGLLSGQDLSKIKDTKSGIYISGRVGISTIFYNVKGIDPRKPKFSYVLSGAPVAHLYGFDLPFSFLLSNYQRDFRQPFNQFGISPYYKSIKLHLGYRNLNFSPYTLAGHRILGGGFEFTPGKFRLAFMYGRFNKAVPRDTTLNPQNNLSKTVRPSFSRKGFAAKIGFGTARNHFDLIVLKAEDDPFSIQSPDISTAIHPEENLVLGISTQFHIIKNLIYKLDIGGSAYSRDINKDSIGVDSFPFKNTLFAIYTPRINTKVSFAGETKLEYKTNKFSWNILYKRVDPGYQSMGAYYFKDDVEQYLTGISFSALKSKFRFRGSFGIQNDNVRSNRASKTTRKIGNLSINFQPNQKFGISMQYSNFGVSQNPLLKSISDTTLLRNVTQSLMIMPRYSFVNKNIMHNVNFMINYQNLNDKNTYTVKYTQMKSLNTNFNYIVSLLKRGLNFRVSALYIRNEISAGKTNSYGGTLGLSMPFFKRKLYSGLNYTYTSNTFNSQSNGYTSRLNLNLTGKLSKSQSLKLIIFLLKNNSKNTQIIRDFTESTIRVSYNISFNSNRKKHF